MNETITTWYGRDIESLTRDELLEAFKELGQMYQKAEQRSYQAMRSEANTFLALARLRR